MKQTDNHMESRAATKARKLNRLSKQAKKASKEIASEERMPDTKRRRQQWNIYVISVVNPATSERRIYLARRRGNPEGTTPADPLPFFLSFCRLMRLTRACTCWPTSSLCTVLSHGLPLLAAQIRRQVKIEHVLHQLEVAPVAKERVLSFTWLSL